MSYLNLLANLGMLALFLGIFPSMRAVYKNKGDVKSFSLIGSIGINVGQFLYLVYFLLQGDYITTALSIPQVAFWSYIILRKLRR